MERTASHPKNQSPVGEKQVPLDASWFVGGGLSPGPVTDDDKEEDRRDLSLLT